jgi:hypothetical protein
MLEFINSSKAFLDANSGVIGMVLSVAFMAAKAFSNANAGPAVAKLQAAVDLVASAVKGIGELLATISGFLANLIKSDGFLGKK